MTDDQRREFLQRIQEHFGYVVVASTGKRQVGDRVRMLNGTDGPYEVDCVIVSESSHREWMAIQAWLPLIGALPRRQSRGCNFYRVRAE
jgi:hypothetical protein